MKTKQELLDHHSISESTLETLIDIRDVLNKFVEQEAIYLVEDKKGGYFSGTNMNTVIEESNEKP